MSYYLCFSVGFYVGAALINLSTFKDADSISIFLGIIAALFFPITIVMLLLGGDHPNKRKDAHE